ncbi:unnamed protein product [Prunus brigantina]
MASCKYCFLAVFILLCSSSTHVAVAARNLLQTNTAPTFLNLQQHSCHLCLLFQHCHNPHCQTCQTCQTANHLYLNPQRSCLHFPVSLLCQLSLRLHCLHCQTFCQDFQSISLLQFPLSHFTLHHLQPLPLKQYAHGMQPLYHPIKQYGLKFMHRLKFYFAYVYLCVRCIEWFQSVMWLN